MIFFYKGVDEQLVNDINISLQITVNGVIWNRHTFIEYACNLRNIAASMTSKLPLALRECINLSFHKACMINVLYEETVQKKNKTKRHVLIVQLDENACLIYSDQYDRMNQLDFVKTNYSNVKYLAIYYYNQ